MTLLTTSSLAALWLAVAPTAHASPTPQSAALHAKLASEADWQHVRTDNGVQVYKKDVPGTNMMAWKGEKDFPATIDKARLFAVITDTNNHTHISPGLLESTIIHPVGTGALYYQVMDAPRPIADRYWIAQSASIQDADGHPGHLRRTWSSVGGDAAQATRAMLQERYPDAVEVPETHGRWDLIPLDDGGLRVVYRTLVDPGGAVPQSIANSVAGRGVSENIEKMVAASTR